MTEYGNGSFEPCPFCGENDWFYTEHTDSSDKYMAWCRRCKATNIFVGTKEEMLRYLTERKNVVRCSECVNRYTLGCPLWIVDSDPVSWRDYGDDFYCARGERKYGQEEILQTAGDGAQGQE